MKLYYFPDAVLLCDSNDQLNFNVINGGWSFKLQGEQAVDDWGREVTVGTYQVHSRKSFNKSYPNFGY